jgi:predicted alpha/beta-hydrolase family hydrolase
MGTPVTDVATPVGTARIHRYGDPARALVVLGHGAGGGPDAPDLAAVRDRLVADGIGVVLVEQPYRVAGRRAPAPAGQLDAAWREVCAVVRRPATPLVVGGRSSGARVACRTALAVGADAVVALAFPLHPPGRPERSRVDELLQAGVPTLVVQGERDAFGAPEEFPRGVLVATVPGDHGLRKDPAAVADAVAGWLAQRLAQRLA